MPPTPDPTDTEFECYTLTNVEPDHEDPENEASPVTGWSVDMDGLGLWVTAEHVTEPPVVGETMRLYGEGMGRPVRGIEIGGRCYRYETVAEHKASEARRRAESEAKQLREWTEKLDETSTRIAALPGPLRDRMYRFLNLAWIPDWGPSFGFYELFCCEQAVVIADALKTEDAIVAWVTLPHADQLAAVPGLNADHSGNTFGMSYVLARILCRADAAEIVPKMHAAFCPVTGCARSGCYAAELVREEAAGGGTP